MLANFETSSGAAALVDSLSVENEINAVLLVLAVAAPLVIGAILLISQKVSDKFAAFIATAGFSIPVLIGAWLWANFSVATLFPDASATGNDGYFFEFIVPTGLQNFGIQFHFGLNGVSLAMFMLAAVVSFAAGLFAVASRAERKPLYYALLLIMQGGLMGIFASVDVFFFYFFHEIALIPTFIMMLIWGGRRSREASIEMAIYLTLGAMLSLVGLIALYVQSDAEMFSLPELRRAVEAVFIEPEGQKNIFGLLLFGFGILVSLFPFHSWAPRTYASAPTAATMMHAGVLKKFGLYGLIQIAAPLLVDGAGIWQEVLIILALGNILIIGLITLSVQDLKLMLGYSSVMHMGYAFLGIACLSALGVGGAVMMMIAHGLSVALLFMLATLVQHRTGTSELSNMGGLAVRAPILAAMFVAGIMASIGLPGFANFWGEFTIFVALWELDPGILALAALGIIISAIYGLRATANIFFGEPSPTSDQSGPYAKVGDISTEERVPAFILIGALLILGIWPKLLSDHVDREIAPQYPMHAELAESSESSPDGVAWSDAATRQKTTEEGAK